MASQGVASPGRSKKGHRETQTNVASSENVSNARVNRPTRGIYVSSVPVSGGNVDVSTEVLRSNIERSQSQNAYDSPRLRDRFIRRDHGGKPELKSGECDSVFLSYDSTEHHRFNIEKSCLVPRFYIIIFGTMS